MRLLGALRSRWHLPFTTGALILLLGVRDERNYVSRFYVFTMLNVCLTSNVAGTCLALGSWIMMQSQTMGLCHPLTLL